MKVSITNGIASIDVREMFNKGVSQITKKNALDLFILLGKEQGTRVDTEIVDIDLFDETKAFDYDLDGNPIVHSGSHCSHEILYWSVKEYARRSPEDNVIGINFDVDEGLEGSIEINDCRIICTNISPDEINLDGTDLEAEYLF